jgi:MFS family permease
VIRDDPPSRTVLKYYLYRAVGNPGFIYPVYVLYLVFHDVSYAQIGIIGSVQSVIVLAGEVPTGYVGDRIGRRNSILVGQALFTASAVGMLVADGFLTFTVAFALLSTGQTFVSGSASAWLYDALEERLDADHYTHVKGRGVAIGKWVMAATMVAGGLLYAVGRPLPFVAALVMRVVTIGVVVSFPKTGQYADDDRGDATESDDQTDDDTLTVLEALPVIRDQLATPPLRSFVAYVAAFLGVTLTVGIYVQPIAVDGIESTVGPTLATYGVPETASLGVLYASFTAVSALASDRASDLEEWLGVRGAILAVPAVTAVLLLAPAVVPLVAFPMFFVLKGGQSILRPIVGQYLNDRIESVGRATVLSGVSMVYALVRIPLSVGSGVVADATSPLTAVATLGATFVVLGGAVWLVGRPASDAPTAEASGASPAD